MPEVDWVLVHDAARALVTPQLITSIIDTALATDAAGVVPGIPVTDTVKKVEHDQVVETLDRSSLVAVQTPQAFDREVLVRAHAHHPSIDATDDAALVERMGGTVVVVPGDVDNIKITYPEDLERARAIAQERGAS